MVDNKNMYVDYQVYHVVLIDNVLMFFFIPEIFTSAHSLFFIFISYGWGCHAPKLYVQLCIIIPDVQCLTWVSSTYIEVYSLFKGKLAC